MNSNYCVLGQSQEEEFKFQFVPIQVNSTLLNTNKNQPAFKSIKPRLSYATDNSEENEEPKPLIEFPE